MTDQWTDRLSDYLDGEMSPAERARLEAHVDADPECASALDGLRQVVNRARSLDERVPATAQRMWTEIASRIGATPPAMEPQRAPARAGWWSGRRLSLSLPQLLAAGIALVLLSGAGAWMVRSGRQAAPAVIPVAAGNVAFASVGATRYDEAVTDLAQVLEAERERLNPETVRIVEENLTIIDRAIAQARRALLDDPDSDYLRRHLEQTMRQKLTLLQQVTTIPGAL